MITLESIDLFHVFADAAWKMLCHNNIFYNKMVATMKTITSKCNQLKVTFVPLFQVTPTVYPATKFENNLITLFGLLKTI